jgi:hypothetical protein
MPITYHKYFRIVENQKYSVSHDETVYWAVKDGKILKMKIAEIYKKQKIDNVEKK